MKESQLTCNTQRKTEYLTSRWHLGLGCCLEPGLPWRPWSSSVRGLCWYLWLLLSLRVMRKPVVRTPTWGPVCVWGTCCCCESHANLGVLHCHLGPWWHPGSGCCLGHTWVHDPTIVRVWVKDPEPWCHRRSHGNPGSRLLSVTMLVFEGRAAASAKLIWVASAIS